tara:strand:+ start:273 stop:860 length:588 start_codon:yes stop_codon:yes gene_type:complete
MKHLRNIPICANTLFVYKLDIEEDLILKFTKEKFKPTASPTLQSKDFNVLKKYKGLNKEINKAIDLTLKEILLLKNINYRIFRSWLTKVKPGGSSGSHTHSNSWLSGVYYPQGNPGFGIKFFYDNTAPFFTQPTAYNIYNSSEWVIVPEDNFLILFFSQIRHEIMPNQSEKDRFSLSFNLFPKGEFGENDSKIIF